MALRMSWLNATYWKWSVQMLYHFGEAGGECRPAGGPKYCVCFSGEPPRRDERSKICGRCPAREWSSSLREEGTRARFRGSAAFGDDAVRCAARREGAPWPWQHLGEGPSDGVRTRTTHCYYAFIYIHTTSGLSQTNMRPFSAAPRRRVSSSS